MSRLTGHDRLRLADYERTRAKEDGLDYTPAPTCHACDQPAICISHFPSGESVPWCNDHPAKESTATPNPEVNHAEPVSPATGAREPEIAERGPAPVSRPRCPDCGPVCPECEEVFRRVGSRVVCGCTS